MLKHGWSTIVIVIIISVVMVIMLVMIVVISIVIVMVMIKPLSLVVVINVIDYSNFNININKYRQSRPSDNDRFVVAIFSENIGCIILGPGECGKNCLLKNLVISNTHIKKLYNFGTTGD